MENCLVLAARHYDFTDDKGRRVEGCQVIYVTDDILTEGNTRGAVPMTVAAPMAVLNQLGKLPAYYQLDFRQRPGPKGKPSLHLVQADFVGSLPAVLPTGRPSTSKAD